jgi:alpha-mannosidase
MTSQTSAPNTPTAETNDRTLLVVPHTHWDREWYLTFQQFRMKLVATVDAVLDIMERDPGYARFLLDGQTIILDDYLEVRPENAARLQWLAREGRILVGPWYIQPDEFLVSGESLVRNLLRGRRMAREWAMSPTPSATSRNCRKSCAASVWRRLSSGAALAQR